MLILSTLDSKDMKASLSWLNAQVFGEVSVDKTDSDDDDDDDAEELRNMVQCFTIDGDGDDDAENTPPNVDTPSVDTDHLIATSALHPAATSDMSQPTPVTEDPSVSHDIDVDIVTPDLQIPAVPKKKAKTKKAQVEVLEDAPAQPDQPAPATRTSTRCKDLDATKRGRVAKQKKS